jgi:hypothetical protein
MRNLSAELARIDRQRAELHERPPERFNRDWWYAPLCVVLMGLAAIAARLPEILAAFGVKP